MRTSKILATIFTICIIVSGCSQKNIDNSINNTNKDDNKGDITIDSHNKKEEKQNDISKEAPIEVVITDEEYKILAEKNYEKYIKPLNIDTFEYLKEKVDSEESIENEDFLIEYKENIKDNKANLKSFEQSMSNLNIENAKTKEINNKLITECKVLVRDLELEESYLDVLDEDVLSKSNDDFIKFIDEVLNREELDKSKLEEVMIEAQNTLGIEFSE